MQQQKIVFKCRKKLEKIISSLEEDKLGTIDDGLNNIIAWHQNEAIATLVTDLNKNDELKVLYSLTLTKNYLFSFL